jgi:hypothetical protein
MNTAAQNNPYQLELISEPLHYHGATNAAFIALLAKQDSGRMRQHMFRACHLDKVLAAAPRDRDSYLSQASFLRDNRRAVSIHSLPMMFSDLDPPKGQKVPPDVWRHRVLLFCDDEGLPSPSLIVYSGRGVHLKWLLSDPVPRAALPRWNLLQSLLGERLAPIGADPMARDASRVLRLEHTVNTKTGERCEVIWTTDGGDGHPVRYAFDTLFDEVAPLARGELEEIRKERHQQAEEQKANHIRWNERPALTMVKGGRYGLKRINYQELAWHRLEDLRTLAVMRAKQNGGLEGERMAFLFWSLNFMGLSNAVSPSSLWQEAQSLAATLTPGWRYERGELSTLYRKLCGYVKGETVEFNGRRYPGLYTPRNATLIEFFRITPEEQRLLKTIISKEEARHRDAERKRTQRREAGAVDRSEYEANAQHRREVARAMRTDGATNSEIALKLGVHVKSVSRLIRVG